MMSTAESGVSGYDQGGAGAGAGAQAEMITKKLANYWCLIGSIPLVLFLLVAIPTIFFVKKFSDYVNAHYCDTKSCKDIADMIQAAGSPSDACSSLAKAACKTKQKDYITQLWQNLQKEITGSKLLAQETPPEVLALCNHYRTVAQQCIANAPTDGDFSTQLLDAYGEAIEIGKTFDISGGRNLAYYSGKMSAYGIDGLVRAVAILGKNNEKSLELSAPFKDMYPSMLMEIFNQKSYKGILQGIDDDTYTPQITDTFAEKFAAFALDKTSKLKDHIPVVMTKENLLAKDAAAPSPNGKPGWSWTEYFEAMESTPVKATFDPSTKIRLSHPTYLLGLREFADSTETLVGGGPVWLQVQALLHMAGPMVFGKAQVGKYPYLCYHWADRFMPGASSAVFFMQRNAQFGAGSGINPGGTNASSMATLLRKEVQDILDSTAFSLSLAVSAPEETRAAYYTLTKKTSVIAGAFYDNSSKELKDDVLKKFEPGPLEEDATVQFWIDARNKWAEKYWAYEPDVLKFREPMGSSQVYASYSPTEQHLFVPMGAFTKPFFRNTKNNRAFAAIGGYAVIAGLMHALTSYGTFVTKGDVYPKSWTGYSWAAKMVKFQQCMKGQRKENNSLSNVMDQHMLGAVTPTFRYYRRMVFKIAYPRPEFRIDWIGDYSSTQIFYYTWAMMHCGTEYGKTLIDLAAKNSKYFHESFQCESKLNPRRCQLWESSRRNY